MADNDVNYKPVADDPAKSCKTCRNFEPKADDAGDCFGNEVLAAGCCDFFEGE